MAFGLCKYRDALGVPGAGVHAYRVAGVAAVDLGLTVLAAAVIAWWFDWSFGYTFIGLMIVGIVVHRAFCVRTALMDFLFERDRKRVELSKVEE
jgi:uncharacterized membrane protein